MATIRWRSERRRETGERTERTSDEMFGFHGAAIVRIAAVRASNEHLRAAGKVAS
jgi:hypothetical protein